MSDGVSSAFCFENASMMGLVCWATALVTILASAASLDSWSWLWSLFSAAEEVVAFLSLDQSLPITRSESVSKMRTYILKQCSRFSYICFEALVVLVVDDLD